MPPLGLCTLAAWIRTQGHSVRILDLDLEIKAPGGEAQESYTTLFARVVLDFQPDVVGVTSMYSNSLHAERLVRVAKQVAPQVITVAGGAHFGALGSEALRRIQELDYVVQGEGEISLGLLLDALNASGSVSGIPRLCYRDGQEVRSIASGPLMDLGDLPPVWTRLSECINLERYAATIPMQAARRLIYIEAGRGCPFLCTFCATAPFWQRKYRVKPVDRLVDEVRFLHEAFGYDSFILVHDLLTVNQRFISQLCDALLESRLPVEWMANSRTDIRLHGLLPKMKAAGCWKLFFGVESAAPRIQASIDKHLDIDGVFSTISDLREHGISATCSFIVGFPDEAATEVSATIAMGARLKLLGAETVQFHRLRLFPPSRLSRDDLSAEFDLDSLRIEYPFASVPNDDVALIAGDPEFFAGYFTPHSQAGSPAQLAQLEMFFHHVVALAPLTVCALAQFAGNDLVPSFYQAVAASGKIARADLDWESGNLYGNWLALQPLLVTWALEYVELEAWQAGIVRGLLDYEAHRLQFVHADGVPAQDVLTAGENWAAFSTTVALSTVLERLSAGTALTPDLLRLGIIALVRQGQAAFAAFVLDPALLPKLEAHEPEIVNALRAAAAAG